MAEHARKGDPMPCPACAVGTCIPCYTGSHQDCSNNAGAIVGCTCTHEPEKKETTYVMRDFG